MEYVPTRCPKCHEMGDMGLRLREETGWPKCLCASCGCTWFNYELPIWNPMCFTFFRFTIADGVIMNKYFSGEITPMVEERAHFYMQTILEREWHVKIPVMKWGE